MELSEQGLLGVLTGPVIVNILFALATTAAAFVSIAYRNVAWLLLPLALTKLVDIFFINSALLSHGGIVFYFAYGVFDLLVIALIYYRGDIANLINLHVGYKRLPQEYLLMTIYMGSVVVNIITLIEHFVRNSNGLKQLIGLNSDLTPMFFYHLYQPIKLFINVVENTLIIFIAFMAFKIIAVKRREAKQG